MSTSVRMGRLLPESSQDKRGQFSTPELSDERDNPSRWFRELVGTYEVQKEAAAHVGVNEPYLNRMCTGAKPVHLVHLERVRRLHVVGFQRLVEAMARDAQMLVVSANELTLTAEQRALLLTSRDVLGPQLWPAYRDKLAARVFRCGGDLLDHALDYEAQRK